ncbi:MAG: calcium/sodium antiporter [Clostridiales bacterium]|nr:calcium/sodium antiporter [Clostridiales bacterium]
MDIALTLLLFVVGIVIIIKGGDFFVDAASWIAEVSGIPKLIVGATVVSIATTLPELLVSLLAAAEGKVDMAIGNAVGSVTVNIGLIMAISLICMPGLIKRKDYILKSVLMVAAAAVVVFSGIIGEVRLPIAIVMLIIFGIFIWENIAGAKKAMLDTTDTEKEDKRSRPDKKEITVNVVKFIVGAVGIVLGARLLVDNGSELARFIGISERIIGVTVIAVGTSLPELITTVTAIAKKQSSLSVGNILGANIIDLTLILPLSSVVSGKALPISHLSGIIDLPACIIVALIAIMPMLIKSKFYRWQGIALIIVYAAYITLTCTVS